MHIEISRHDGVQRPLLSLHDVRQRSVAQFIEARVGCDDCGSGLWSDTS